MQCTICGKFAIFHIPGRQYPGDRPLYHFCSLNCWEASKAVRGSN